MNHSVLRCFFLALLTFAFTAKILAQSTSNQGNEFWIPFPTHEPDFDKNFNTLNANISVFLTGPESSSGIITAGTFKQSFSILPNRVTEVKLPREQCYIKDTDAGQVLANRAIHVLVDTGMPKIVVYAHIFAGQRSAASLVLPKEALGQNYYSMNFNQYGDEGKNYIAIVATEPNTRVFIKKGKTDLVNGGVLLKQVNDVYEFLSAQDLTGVSVTVDTLTSACKHIAVFSGSSGVKIANKNCEPRSLDPLYQQCYPTESWGLNYGFIPFSKSATGNLRLERTAGQYVRIIAKDDTTAVAINGKQIAVLNAGEFYASPSPLNEPAFIVASKPVSVAQFAISQSCGNLDNSADTLLQGYSDPDMVILNPIEFNIDDITVYSSTRENIKEQYINVILKTDAAASFLINGTLPPVPFSEFISLPGYSYLQLNLNAYKSNNFHLTAREGFNAVAYGFGNVESYAYSAGTNLIATQSLNALKSGTLKTIDSACVNDDYFFKLTLPFISPRIQWKMAPDQQATIQDFPTFKMIKLNNRLSYEYTLPKPLSYKTAGTRRIDITADYPTNKSNCDFPAQTISGSFKVLPLPKAEIAAMPDECGNSYRLRFVGDSTRVKRIQWDFGDPKSGRLNIAETISAGHTFPDSGAYVIKLTATSLNDCDTTILKTIRVNRHVSPGFETTGLSCRNRSVVLKDHSHTNNFKVASWFWRFGDGDSCVVNTDTVKHLYKTAGQYRVSLILKSDKGCLSDTFTKLVTISEGPIADFAVPGVCLTDAAAHFSTKSSGTGITPETLRYIWDFGDPSASAGNPNESGEENPDHTYTNVGAYLVKLTVLDENGCDASIIKTITVNGVLPKADFKPLNPAGCSGGQILFKDLSYVADFGRITKLEWYFDNENAPGKKEMVTEMRGDQTYSHAYPDFYGPPFIKRVAVKLKAYSGNACADSSVQFVAIYAKPRVQFENIPAMCVTAMPLVLDQGKELTGITGDGGYYSGLGVSDGRVFNPLIAGIGEHLIKYKFTTSNGCTDSALTVIKVLSPPKVSQEGNITIKQGDSYKLNPLYSSGNFKYKWTPAIGLDNDSIPFPAASPAESITYKVVVSNGYCQAEGTVAVHVLLPLEINNSFSPNGDGTNDLFIIKNLAEYPKATVDVFNRYGTLLYHSLGNSRPWDGTYNGKELPMGVYYYVINLKDGQTIYTGYVTIIR